MIKKYVPEDRMRWDDYVSKKEEGSLFHQINWGVALSRSFPIGIHHIYAQEAGRIVGACPLYAVKDRVYGHRLMSVPIGVCGGILADTSAIAQLLLQEACEIAREYRAHQIEFRNTQFDIYGDAQPSNLVPKPTHAIFSRRLPLDKNDCLSQMPRKARADARHAIEAGLRLNEIPSKNGFQICYHLYAANQKRLGSPVFAFHWFRMLASVFGDQCKVHLVYWKDSPIGGVLSFLFKDQILPFYGGTLKKYYTFHTASFMYLKLQEWAVERGIKIFNFGRSRIGSGAYEFKVHQGFVPQPLNYHLAIIDQGARDRYQARGDRIFKATHSILKWTPLILANSLGPLIFPKFMP